MPFARSVIPPARFSVSEIFGQIIELKIAALQELDQLEVALAYRAGGLPTLIAVVWIVPEQGPALRSRTATQQAGEAAAIESCVGITGPGQLGESGVKIHGDERRGVRATRLDLAGPPCD